MNQLTRRSKAEILFSEDIYRQLETLGISPEDLSQQFTSLDLSLDEVAKKIASVGVPSILLVAILTNFGGTPLVTTLATSLTGTIGVIGDTITGYGIEVAVVNFYIERLKQEDLEDLLDEIDILPLTDALKAKVRDTLNKEDTPRVARRITIVQD